MRRTDYDLPDLHRTDRWVGEHVNNMHILQLSTWKRAQITDRTGPESNALTKPGHTHDNMTTPSRY